jgi:hypothetical protein
MLTGARQVKGEYFRAVVRCQPPPEKCDANDRANEPNPPRVTPPDSEAVLDEELLDDELLDEEAPPKKLLRDHDPPPPPLDEDPRQEHPVLVCGNDGAAIPGDFGSQFSRGINP